MQNNDEELVEPPEVDNQTYQLETLNTLVLQDFRRMILPKQEVSSLLAVVRDYHRKNLMMDVTSGAFKETSTTEQHFVNTNEIMVHGSLHIEGLSERNPE
ncbi:hypothetical protein MHU86_16115 [Fragilaria crotonensis]|nr:hypothetical protein MHU86_16115 [Fragilaria crotonensis]